MGPRKLSKLEVMSRSHPLRVRVNSEEREGAERSSPLGPGRSKLGAVPVVPFDATSSRCQRSVGSSTRRKATPLDRPDGFDFCQIDSVARPSRPREPLFSRATCNAARACALMTLRLASRLTRAKNLSAARHR